MTRADDNDPRIGTLLAYSSAFNGVELSDLKELKTVPALAMAPSEPDDQRIENLLRAGATEADVAVTVNSTLSRVLEVKRSLGLDGVRTTTKVTQTQTQQNQMRQLTQLTQQVTQSIQKDLVDTTRMPSARAIIAARIHDFQEVLDLAKNEYLSNPDSESNYNAMNGFMKTMKDLFKAYQDLDDPQDVAEKIVKQIIAPYMANTVRQVIDSAKKIMEDLQPTLANEYQTAQLRDGLNDSLRQLRETTRTEYNRAVKTLEVVCEVKLDTLLMRPEPLGTGADVFAGQP